MSTPQTVEKRIETCMRRLQQINCEIDETEQRLSDIGYGYQPKNYEAKYNALLRRLKKQRWEWMLKFAMLQNARP